MRKNIVTILSNPAALRRKCSHFPAIEEFTDADKASIQDLKDTFDVIQGYGLSLPQIGTAKRAIIVNFSALGLGDLGTAVTMINPEIEIMGPTDRFEESCFSVPHISAHVTRHTSAIVRYTSESGQLCKLDLTGFPAVCLQHEIDHLDGLTFLNRVGTAWRSILLKKIKKIEKRNRTEAQSIKDEFDQEHREIMGISPKKKTGHSSKRSPKVRKKRPNRSKKRK